MRHIVLTHLDFDHAGGMARLANQTRLRVLKRSHGGEIQVFCAHDAEKFAKFGSAALPPAVTEISSLRQHA